MVCPPESPAAVIQPIERASSYPPTTHTIQHFNMPIETYDFEKVSYYNFSIPKVPLFLLPSTSSLKPNAAD
jgi:hypothetical protein